jgi:hypothetical protein
MLKRISSYAALTIVVMVLTTLFRPLDQSSSLAQGGCQTFKETGKQVCGRFLQYWQQNGGLPQQGFPLSNEFTEVSPLDGKPYVVQYFERAVFEKHPENQAPFDVLLSQLGTFQFKAKYPGGDPSGNPQPQPTPASVSIKGQTIEFPGLFGSGKLRGTVTEATETNTIPASDIYPTSNASGKFVVVFMTVTIIGSTSATVGYELKMKDQKGRVFDQADYKVQRNASAAYHLDIWDADVQPGLSANIVAVYDVAPDAVGYVLVLAK